MSHPPSDPPPNEGGPFPPPHQRQYGAPQQPHAGDQRYGAGPYGQQPHGTPPPRGQPHGHRPYGTPAQPASAVGGKPPAEWWQRLVARLIDSLVVIVPVVLLYMGFLSLLITGNAMVAGNLGIVVLGGGTHFGADLLAGLLALSLLVSYETFMLNRYGRTVGKMAMGVRVLSLEEPPRPDGGIPMNTSVLRGVVWWGPTALGNMLPFIGGVVHLFPILNGLWPLWDQPNRQSLNDKIAKTVVVDDR